MKSQPSAEEKACPACLERKTERSQELYKDLTNRLARITGQIRGIHFNGDYSTILIIHLDRPGVIADVTQLMRTKYPGANIANFRLSRRERGGESIMTIEIDGAATEGMAIDLREVNNVISALVIKRL